MSVAARDARTRSAPGSSAALGAAAGPTRREVLAFGAISLAAFVFLAWFGRDLTFFHDEWEFILHRRLDLAGLLEPHNEHWVSGLVLIYRGLVDAVGISSYAPFLLVLLGLHVGVAWVVFLSVSRWVGATYGLAGGTVMLVLGSGSENILWAFQIGFVLATLFGLAGFALASTRPRLAALLLVLAVATQGNGLIFVAATIAHRVLLRDRRGALWALLPVVVYAGWLLAFGLGGLTSHQSPLGQRSLEYLLPYVAYGLATAFGAPFGGGAEVGFGVLVVVSIGLVLMTRRLDRERALLGLACLAALLAEYGLIALVRSTLGPLQATAPRYVYVAAPFVILLVCLAISSISQSRVRAAVGIAVFVVALSANVVALVRAHDALVAREACEMTLPPGERWTSTACG